MRKEDNPNLPGKCYNYGWKIPDLMPHHTHDDTVRPGEDRPKLNTHRMAPHQPRDGRSGCTKTL